ncbi:Putative uncharacterized protein [Taphrina deformans PYCC 5710]|uniref:Uncharacterized protein n=1 Tax=Taphrina deformans (strain PYCC 5710 / ATCC 11124 / CBS 356.35 / IMI 108563 / JCM 9778 / NBRC 8474) TaxID=1097556 RepID=R4X736_TAPDE|nr:Putative uncharacterized protein [Taphrina deformans PYCC 5710]|eukprot:CCG80863.1 Putative uncharacterized protein [Taphrina deformans PYCC 5710]
MSFSQTSITLPSRSKGFYIITNEIVKAAPISQYKIGLCNIFLLHTSAAITINENWDADTRLDLSDAMDRIAPDQTKELGPTELYRHNAEGPDDMPSHIKSSLLGASLTVPIKDGKLALGQWQDIQLAEFRAMKHQRRLIVTIQGEKK